MTRVTITGWREGLNKVRLNRLLRDHAGYDLAAAKRAVDELLDGQSLTFETPDPETASAFCLPADAAGAICRTVGEKVSGTDPTTPASSAWATPR